jgi:hypothetical protein
MQATSTGVENATLLFHNNLISYLDSQFSKVSVGLCCSSEGLMPVLGIKREYKSFNVTCPYICLKLPGLTGLMDAYQCMWLNAEESVLLVHLCSFLFQATLKKHGIIVWG